MNDNILEVQNISKKFNEFTLNNISFSLPRGYIMGLVGKNGAGKTTTIKLILDLLEKDSGYINVLGTNIEKNHTIKEDIAVVFDDFFFVDDWTIMDVENSISPFYKNWESQVFHNYLSAFHLSKNKKISELSKGMKIKLMLAVALSHKAKLLILDEPTSGLDPVARDEILDILLEYIEDDANSILFSTHITTDLDQIADYLTIMNNGNIFYSGEKEQLFENYVLVKGSLNDLDVIDQQNLIGIHKRKHGFSALIEIDNIQTLTENMITETATIDDILIHINLAYEGVNADD